MVFIQILMPAVLFLTQLSAQAIFPSPYFKRITFDWSVLCGHPAGFRLSSSLGLCKDREAPVFSAWAQQTDGISLSLRAQLQFNTVITSSFLFLKPCPNKTNSIPAVLQHRQKWSTHFCLCDHMDGLIMRPEWILDKNHQQGESHRLWEEKRLKNITSFCHMWSLLFLLSPK